MKPANVLITTGRRGDRLRLPRGFRADRGTPSSQSRLTATGQFVGTVDYVAPEQIQALGRIDRRVRHLLARLRSLRVPHWTPTVPGRDRLRGHVGWHVHEQPPAVTEPRSELPVELDAIVARALAKSPDDRYQTAGELSAAVRRALGDTRRSTVVSPRPQSDRRRWLQPLRHVPARLLAVALAAAAAIAALAVGVALFMSRGNPPSPQGNFPELRLGQQLSMRDCLERLNQPTNAPTAAQLEWPVRLVSFLVSVQGLVGSTAPVDSLIRRAPDSTLVGPTYRPIRTVVAPPAETFTGDGQICVPVPRTNGSFYVELRLRHEDTLLSTGETRRFRGVPATRQPPPPPTPPSPSPTPPPPPPPVNVIQ